MKEETTERKRRLGRILLILLTAVTLCSMVLAARMLMGTGDSVLQGKKDASSIAIPGYEGLTLRANTREQEVSLSNPESNACLFRISLLLEDGTCLWQSDYIRPGKAEQILLNDPIPPGTYPNATLHYDCFQPGVEKKPLNGAETKLTLRVK